MRGVPQVDPLAQGPIGGNALGHDREPSPGPEQ